MFVSTSVFLLMCFLPSPGLGVQTGILSTRSEATKASDFYSFYSTSHAIAAMVDFCFGLVSTVHAFSNRQWQHLVVSG